MVPPLLSLKRWRWGRRQPAIDPVIIAPPAFSSNESQEKEVWSVKTSVKQSQHVPLGVERGFPGFTSSYELKVEEGQEGSPRAMVCNH